MTTTKKAQLTKAQLLAAEINSVFGAGTVVMGNDPQFQTRILPTGVVPIDNLLGGGLPRNRCTEIFGQYSTLKSYIGLRAVASTQAQGGICAYIDSEHSYEDEWARQQGVNDNDLLLKQPKTGEEAIDLVEAMIRMKVDLIVMDSVAAMLPRAEQKTAMNGAKEMQPARLAALMSLALRKLTSANSTTALLWINQTRISVGVMFGDPEKTTGGLSLPFYASHRIALRKAGNEKRTIETFKADGTKDKVKEVTSFRVRATLEKSKLTRPHREVLFDFDLATGRVDDVGFLIQHGLETGNIIISGQTWKADETSKRGKEAFRTWLESTAGTTTRQALQASCLGSPAPPKTMVVGERRKRLVKKA